jgi:hypothetical protein
MIAPIKTVTNLYYQPFRAHVCQFIVGRIPFEYLGVPQKNNQHNHVVLTWSKGLKIRPGSIHGYVMLNEVKSLFG